jgi:SAM-dependent methyltransferase
MGLLNQSRFPRLWLWFQYLIGGSCHKQALARKYLKEGAEVLEVGCSVGNVARGFTGLPHLSYTGVDIDAVAIHHAQRAFRGQPQFRFVCADLRQLDWPEASFDYIILSAMLHHVDAAGSHGVLAACVRLLAPAGTLVVTDPVWPAARDSWLVHFFNRIEQGQYVRPEPELRALVESVAGLTLCNRQQLFLAGSPLGFPRIARCAFYRLVRTGHGERRELPPGQGRLQVTGGP